MEMPTLTDGHRKMERLTGTWKGVDTLHPSPWDPDGGVASGRFERRLALDGFVLLGDYEQERDGVVSFRGQGVYSYDPAEDRYTAHWWDTMSPIAQVYHGRFEGDVLELVCEDDNGHTRITNELTEPDKLRFFMDHSPDGKTWTRLMESVYERMG